MQKIADPQWLREIGEIYRHYEMYHQSTANDQAVFDPVSGRPSGRCEVLARRLLESGKLPRSGTLLDVGAGSGAMLAAFSAANHGWKLYALDLDDRKEPALAAIPRFERLFTGGPGVLSLQFDLMTLIHSLEHFSEPLSMLRALRAKIAPGGQLFVQVNNAERTPFDLVVADHLCHFTPRSLAYLAGRAGFGIETTRTDWINKEISMLVPAHSQGHESVHDDPARTIVKIQANVAWLSGMLENARRSAVGGEFGIFGTSVAATWLASGLGDAVKFFVDEDPAREGRMHLGRPIFKPGQVPEGATVYLAFLPEVSEAIRRRLANLPVEFAAPFASAN
ncbi:MAG: class I SAM-dependent methyltransferase [Betaproteobacteria bacterium]|nr:class I SAM-dependent methyltransferase [Betaproteobacteria bacterium]